MCDNLRSMASDLGLHCLPMSLLWDARLKWVNRDNAVDTRLSPSTQFLIGNFYGLPISCAVSQKLNVIFLFFFPFFFFFFFFTGEFKLVTYLK